MGRTIHGSKIEATHHGSEEDFSAEWMEKVNPYLLVVSSGTSSFFHPRPEAVCSNSVINNLRILGGEGLKWHPIRSYGFLSSLNPSPNLVPVCSGMTDNFRFTPYSYCMTNAGIYVTADQGTVKLSFDKNNVTVTSSKQEGEFDFEEALQNFLASQSNEWSDLVIHPPSVLSEDLFKCIQTHCTSLKSLDLSHCNATDGDTNNIISTVTTLTNLSTLIISPNSISRENKTNIHQAWGFRGLRL